MVGSFGGTRSAGGSCGAGPGTGGVRVSHEFVGPEAAIRQEDAELHRANATLLGLGVPVAGASPEVPELSCGVVLRRATSSVYSGSPAPFFRSRDSPDPPRWAWPAPGL